MFNSILRKQYLLYMSILFFSFVLLGGVLSKALKDYFTEQKEKMLKEQGEKLASLYANSYLVGIFQYDKIRNEVQILNKYLDSGFIFVNSNFIIEGLVGDFKNSIGERLSLSELEPVMSGYVVTAQIKASNIFSEQAFVVGYPVIIGRTVVGAILMISSMPELQRTISEAYRIIVLCLLISGIIAFILIYLFSRKMSRPLMEINDAAKVIASGDFDRRININVNDEVGQLADSFNNMAESLSNQEKMRKEFIANISHDFRTPLTSMRGFLQAMQDGTIPQEKQSYYIGIVSDETERLSKLANDILDINKFSALELELNKTDFDLNELIRKTVILFESNILKKELNMNVTLADSRTIVSADYEKIQRVVYNLLDNAVKFTPSSGSIAIDTSIKEDKIYVSIKDSGRGIRQADQKRVFERFYKVDLSRSEDKRGSGLGLSIVKEFIKAHGENIILKSELNDGSEFIFTLSAIK